jgi:hypothetical protein
MKRLLANLALTAILSSFALPLAAALQLSQTPACCLPGGKHHCQQVPSGAGLKDKNDICPFAPPTLATAITTAVAEAIFKLAGLVIVGDFGPNVAQTEHLIAIRELSARGPPVAFLS